MTKDKSRYFTFLLYPDSIPVDWEMKLETIGVPIAISPLHDKDLSKVENQVYKKAHYHVIYVAKNPVTAESVRLKIKRVLGENSLAKVQIIVQSMENMYLYLMPKESSEMRSVTVRIPKDLYENYKEVLLSQGKIVTYDLRRYMNDVVEDSSNKKKGSK